MRKISFEELCEFVTKVNHSSPSTYPINFKVDDAEYCVGIGDFDSESDINFDGIKENLQYLLSFRGWDGVFLDVQNPDMMTHDKIINMIQQQCVIKTDSMIQLYEGNSFNGEQLYSIDWDFCSDDVKDKVLKSSGSI